MPSILNGVNDFNDLNYFFKDYGYNKIGRFIKGKRAY